MPQAVAEDRPLDARRTDYKAFGREDQFIVPLLGELITGAIEKFGSNAAPGAKALDAGCGGQPFRPLLEKMGYDYVGLDAVQNPEGTVDVLGALDAVDLPEVAARGPYDLILCTEVMEHVAFWDRAFDNLSGWLAPGGRLVITAPFFWKLHEVPYDFWRPTLYAYRAYAARFGLREVDAAEAGHARLVAATALAQLDIRERSTGAYGIFWRKVFSLWRHIGVKLLAARWPDRFVKVNSHFHLSSYIVLEKPS